MSAVMAYTSGYHRVFGLNDRSLSRPSDYVLLSHVNVIDSAHNLKPIEQSLCIESSSTVARILTMAVDHILGT